MENKDIKELNKHQLILITLLITFVVSIATGIVTVSLMNQAPKSVPYTVNNVIQRTIEKVSTTTKETNESTEGTTNINNNSKLENSGDILIKIYRGESIDESKLLGDGVLLSDSGLVLVDTSILNGDDKYTISLNTKLFDLKVIKKFNDGFSILQISEKKVDTEKSENSTSVDSVDTSADGENSSVDNSNQ